MINWNFRKKQKKNNDGPKSVVIRLLGQYGLQNEIFIDIPEGGSYEITSDRTLETFKKSGDTYKTYMLPTSLTVEISETPTEFLEFQEFYNFGLHREEFN